MRLPSARVTPRTDELPLLPPRFESSDWLTCALGNRKLLAAACGSSEGESSEESGGLSSTCGGGLSWPKAGAGALSAGGGALSCAELTPAPNMRNIAIAMDCHFFIVCSLRDDNGVSWFQIDVLRHRVALHGLPVIERHFLLFPILST